MWRRFVILSPPRGRQHDTCTNHILTCAAAAYPVHSIDQIVSNKSLIRILSVSHLVLLDRRYLSFKFVLRTIISKWAAAELSSKLVIGNWQIVIPDHCLAVRNDVAESFRS